MGLKLSLPVVIASLVCQQARAGGVDLANAGMAAIGRGDYQAAVTLFTSALAAGDLAPADQELALVRRAEAYLGGNLPKPALADLDRALQLDPKDQEAAALRQRAQSALASVQPWQYRAMLSARSEVPPSSSNGTGVFSASLETNNVLRYTLSFDGLSGPATAAHIHGPAAQSANAGVIAPLGGGMPSSPVSGAVALTAEQITDLKAGKDYVNVHTDLNKGGEIRGMIAAAPAGGSAPVR
jgi:tetratricopeptide (TPR) repeat protein